MLKVYLLDAAGNVREIYSTSYLHPAVLLNDIKTLLREPALCRSRQRDDPC
jgi:protein SCO1/2